MFCLTELDVPKDVELDGTRVQTDILNTQSCKEDSCYILRNKHACTQFFTSTFIVS